MPRLDTCNYSDAYIAVKGTITIEGANDRGKHNRSLILKNNAPFISCISKINGTWQCRRFRCYNAYYNLIEYSKNYSNTSVTLWNYYKDEPIDPITNSESSKCKTSITWKTDADGDTKEAEFAVPLSHLSKFWRTLDMPLIN